MGVKEEGELFVIEAKCHLFDLFMNQYHSRLSNIIGCNTMFSVEWEEVQ
jgi:hypothetical protein